MRILDLGAHDGFVTNWLGRQLRDKGVTDLIIDGVELNPQAVNIANERARRDGLSGQYKVGLAEDAPDLFQPGSYDVVVAFELIEHVPEVEAFLAVCESMCKPEGRVYLSTPNGTFGAGQNPHHLRVYRAIDLFELCRRRGEVVDLLPGHDGVVTISYTPVSNPPALTAGEGGDVPLVTTPLAAPTAIIHTGAGWEPWSPVDIEERGLGGSETAAVLLAEALSRAGWVVTVYGEMRESTMWRQVAFRHHATFDPLAPADLAVISRQPHLFDRPINAATKLLWCHDTDYGDVLTQERADRADAILVLSNWHREHVHARYPFLGRANGKVVVTRNGIDTSRFPVDLIPPMRERPHRAIYSSSPDRGLDLILRLWPRVREVVPDAEIVYCYSAVYDAVAQANPTLAEFRRTIHELGSQDGAVNLGSLDQYALAGAMAKARVWLAPSWCSHAQAMIGGPGGTRLHTPGVPFCETYCIGAVEAAAAGCRRVMSNWGALPERAAEDERDYGSVLVDPVLDQAGNVVGIDEDAWVAEIVSALTYDKDPGVSEGAHSLSWDGVAAQLASIRR